MLELERKIYLQFHCFVRKQSACEHAISLSEGNSGTKHKAARDAFTASGRNKCFQQQQTRK